MAGSDLELMQELAAMDAEAIDRESQLINAFMRGEPILDVVKSWSGDADESDEPTGEAEPRAQLDDAGSHEVDLGEQPEASGRLSE